VTPTILPTKASQPSASSPGKGTSPSKNSTGPETLFTPGLSLLYQTTCKTRARPTFLMQHRPHFAYLNRERLQNLLRSVPLPNRPQYHLTASSWVLSYLIAAASYRIKSTPPPMWLLVWPLSCHVCHAIKGGQSRPGGISIPTNDHPLRDHGRVLGQRAIFH